MKIKTKRIVSASIVMVMLLTMIVGCGKADVKENTQQDMEEVVGVVAEDEILDPESKWEDDKIMPDSTLSEKDDYFIYDFADASTQKEIGEVDTKSLNNDYIEEVKLSKSINFYLADGSMLGKTKENIVVTKNSESNKFVQITFKDERCVFVLKSDFESATTGSGKKDEGSSESTNDKNFSVESASGTKYAKSTVNIRKGPGTTYDKLGSLNAGQEVTITGTCNGWYEVSYNGGKGYVKNTYLVDEKKDVENNSGSNSGNNNTNGGQSNSGGNSSSTGGSNSNSGSNSSNGGGNSSSGETQAPSANVLSASQVQGQMESALRSAGIPSSVEYAQNLWDSGSVSYYSYEELMAMANDTNASWFEFDAPKTGMDSGAITSLVSNYTGFHGFRLVYQREQGDAYIYTCYCY